MYNFKHVGIIANQELQKHMAKYGYRSIRFSPGVWKYNDKDTIFSLVVDDFLVQYTSEENVTHFLYALYQKYTITANREVQK